jgi:hypothetical protein
MLGIPTSLRPSHSYNYSVTSAGVAPVSVVIVGSIVLCGLFIDVLC